MLTYSKHLIDEVSGKLPGWKLRKTVDYGEPTNTSEFGSILHTNISSNNISFNSVSTQEMGYKENRQDKKEFLVERC